MSSGKPTKFQEYLSETLRTIAAGGYGAMIGILVEAVLRQEKLVSPDISLGEIIGTTTGVTFYGFRREIARVLSRNNHDVNSDDTPRLSPLEFSISPETNLWNQLALKSITLKESESGMRALKTSH